MKLQSVLHRFWKPFLAMILVGCGLAYAFHGSSYHLASASTAVVGSVVLDALLAIVLFVMFSTTDRFTRAKRVISTAFVATGMFCGATILSLILGVPLGKKYLTEAQEWCEQQVPLIDAFKDAHGAYPHSLAEVTDLARAPRFVRAHPSVYTSSGHDYTFYISGCALSAAGWNSNVRRWGSS